MKQLQATFTSRSNFLLSTPLVLCSGVADLPDRHSASVVCYCFKELVIERIR